MWGAIVGDIAGSRFEGSRGGPNPSTIRALYPNGVRELANGDVWNTLAGQPTDDSEMAFALVRTLRGPT